MTSSGATIGLEVRADRVHGVLLEPSGVAAAETSRPFVDLVATATDVVAELRRHRPVDAVGLASPTGVASLGAELTARTGLRTSVERTAHAAGWAEYRYGAGRGSEDLLYLRVQDELDGALVLGGALHRGRSGSAATFGHLTTVPGGRHCTCGSRGCWQQYAGARALTAWVRERSLARVGGGDPALPTAQQVLDDAATGDGEAGEVVNEVAEALGSGIARLVTVLDPGLVLLGGTVSTRHPSFVTTVQTAFERHRPAAEHVPGPRLRGADLGPEAAALGAADLARR